MQMTVLLVDDDQDLRSALSEFLVDEGYKVVCTGSCLEAQRFLTERSREFQIVLTDLKLPDGDGLDIIKAAKVSSPDAATCVMTGYASLETALQAIRLGAYDYLTKPFNFDAVQILIDNMSDKVRLVEENRRIHHRLDQLSRSLDDFNSMKVELARLSRLLQDGFESVHQRLQDLSPSPTSAQGSRFGNY